MHYHPIFKFCLSKKPMLSAKKTAKNTGKFMGYCDHIGSVHKFPILNFSKRTTDAFEVLY